MSTPITISLFCNGRQKDYEAFFTDNHEALQFKVKIDDNVVCFEGSLQESFKIKNKANDVATKPIDPAVLEAVSQQLNQIFF